VQIEYYSTDTKFVCLTPPNAGPVDVTVPVRVQVLAIGLDAAYAACPTASGCRFTYYDSSTPKVDFMSSGGSHGKVWRAQGQLVSAGVHFCVGCWLCLGFGVSQPSSSSLAAAAGP
jgi:hypothetical protein